MGYTATKTGGNVPLVFIGTTRSGGDALHHPAGGCQGQGVAGREDKYSAVDRRYGASRIGTTLRAAAKRVDDASINWPALAGPLLLLVVIVVWGAEISAWAGDVLGGWFQRGAEDMLDNRTTTTTQP